MLRMDMERTAGELTGNLWAKSAPGELNQWHTLSEMASSLSSLFSNVLRFYFYFSNNSLS